MYNLSVSNVRGPETQGYLLGGAITGRYAFSPIIHGAGLNITVMSLSGRVDIGLVSCCDLLPDLWELADGLSIAMQELMDLAQNKQNALPVAGWNASAI